MTLEQELPIGSRRVLASLVASLFAMSTFAGCAADDTASSAETLTVELHFHQPAKVGHNEAEIHVEDADGKPVIGAVVTVEPMMPMHGHGSTEKAVVTDSGDGSYAAFPVTMQMAGAWTIAVKATKGTASGETKVDVNL